MSARIKIESTVDSASSGYEMDGPSGDLKVESPTYQSSDQSSSSSGIGNSTEFVVINGVRIYNKGVVDRLLEMHSPRLTLVPQPKAVSFLWKTYRRVCVDGLLQPFACCIVCKRIVSYQSRTGTSSLIRHKCPPELRPILNLLREDKTPWAMTTTPVDVTQKPDLLERAIKRQRREIKTEVTAPAPASPTGCLQVTPSHVDAMVDQDESNLHICDEGDDPGHLVAEKARQFFLRDLWPITLLESTSFLELAQSLIDLGTKAGSVQIHDVLSRSSVLSDLYSYADHMKTAKNASIFSVEFWKNYEKKKFFTLRFHSLNESFQRISNEIVTSEYKTDDLISQLNRIFESIGKTVDLPSDLAEEDTILVVGDDMMKLDECISVPSFSDFMNSLLDELCEVDDLPEDCRRWRDIKYHLHDIQDAVLRAQIQSVLELATQMFENMSSDGVQLGACYLWWLKFQRKIEMWSSPIFEKLKTREYRFHPIYYYTLCLDPNFKSLRMISDEMRAEAYSHLRKLLRDAPRPPKLEHTDKQEDDGNASSFFEEFMESNSDQVDDLERYLRHMTTSRSDSFEFWRRSDEFSGLRGIAKTLLAIPCVFSPRDRIHDLDSEKMVERRSLLTSDDVFVLRFRDTFCQM